ncbi:MAG: 16S rRNA (cytosine(967)-C(5))-methyltransferase [Gammaproteobacteria bacterium]|nr:16S rRNA (cytosine(967)-C(5))-methyltransferase [Gammaproteobacteria bacterium]MBK79417.1 16S rRNA (cytosine(967)-C(5))-methyltransferase [Gammaproteobacteria bacterium]
MSEPARERASAARLLRQVVVNRRTTDQAFAERAPSPLVQEMVLGSLRHFYSLRAAVDGSLREPLRQKDQDVYCLMIVGAYQLRHMRVPDHAAIFETVAAVRILGKNWARGLVNAVMRRLSREPAEPHCEHPRWLEAALTGDYGAAAADIMAADNTRAPMCLRVNLLRTTAEDYDAQLAAAGLTARKPGRPEAADTGDGPRLGHGPESRILETPVPVDRLPGFEDGLVSVQDAGAQLAAPLLAGEPGSAAGRVLDACAAPGGKLFQLLERQPGLRATALESSADRLAAMQAEAVRLGHTGVDARLADAATLDWWDGTGFDYVLVDAPCSGTGTLRRHPDIKVLREAADLTGLTDLQRRLMANLWRVVEPGGTLLYCTCSILTVENDDVVAQFLAQHPDAREAGRPLTTGRPTRHGWQLLPTDPDTDGFYFARLRKAPPAGDPT